ncbi:hypothetical protein M422DRAFT_268977 [Sphaerobolus stellatus SS14]|uniref:Uncharacterized protein n=1 Tax=Sphaerobolus stellatus (strain SS14) TaxID=990650 RepID=A0A0C9TJ50_SPHS4|nr:hypothetical protein M422DRAFT_268977 [Sphaerobolus stellatus SS14]
MLYTLYFNLIDSLNEVKCPLGSAAANVHPGVDVLVQSLDGLVSELDKGVAHEIKKEVKDVNQWGRV